MGGGGGGHRLTPDRLQELEETAKKSLQDGNAGKRNVFISFASEDMDEVNLLRGQAKNKYSNIGFNDWSLKEPFDSEKAIYIKRGIRERIRQSSLTIVYVSENTVNSKWVDWEIRESIAMGKGVLAMHKGDSLPKSLPQAIMDNKIPVIPWSHKELTKAIEKQSKNR